MPTSRNVIEARGLTRRFGEFVAVDGIALTVAGGEVFALLGANGAGKTTAIRMLCGTLAPTRGEVHVDGIDMIRRPREARGRIGYVAQRFALYGDLTVRENLTLQAGLYGLRNARARVRIDWALERLGLTHIAGARASSIPLGHQRKLAVAAALLHEPAVIFFDEPTSGIDPLARSDFWELVYELAEGGVAVLITTHYMDEALFCDRLALMHAGRIVTEGTPQGLLDDGVDTPLLDVSTTDIAHCLPLLARDVDVLEIVPYAGHLRARLRPGSDSTAAAGRLRQASASAGVAVDAITRARPELEDIVVTLLQAQGVEA